MMQFEKHNVFFVGIGGIGMSALARWFNANDFEVVGYDKTPTSLTTELINEGIIIHFEDSLELIPQEFTKETTLVVYTPAIPDKHTQLNYFIKEGFDIKKRAEVLGKISSSHFTVAVAGTHGKTTTSSMIAHVLHSSGIDTTAFLGGIATNYKSNLILGKTEDAIAVIEADEYDRSFLQLSPDMEVITSVDPDHLDIYGDKDGLLESYKMFYKCISKNGTCLISAKAQKTLQLDKAKEYGIEGEITAHNIRIVNSRFRFDYVNNTHIIKDIQLNLPGNHNTENALAAITIASALGVADAKIKQAFESFMGVKRRFEYIVELSDFTFIDDYAHHPEEISAFIQTLKSLYPERFIEVIFQPHLFSRTRDFATEFASSLSLADSVILMDIYPARELPIDEVSSEIILEKISCENKTIMNSQEIMEHLKNQRGDVLATIGAGNIDALVPKIKDLITESVNHEN